MTWLLVFNQIKNFFTENIFLPDYEYKVKFGLSVLSNLTNDNSDRFYKFTQGLPTLNYQQAVNAAASRGGVLADFKTNFTVEEDSKSTFGYKVVFARF